MKIGQYIAANAHLVAKEYSEVLKVRYLYALYVIIYQILQDMAPARPYEVVERIILEEFGRPVDELFASFDRQHVAAASVAYIITCY